MPIERRTMPDGTENPENPTNSGATAANPSPEQYLAQRWQNLFAAEEGGLQLAEQRADQLGLEGDRRVRFMEIAGRDLREQLFQPQGFPVQPMPGRPGRSRIEAQRRAAEELERDTRTPEERQLHEDVSSILDEAYNEVLSDPENRRKLDSGTQSEQSEVRNLLDQAILAKQQARLATLSPEEFNEHARQVRELMDATGEDVELLTITTQAGQRVEIPWPRTPEGKIDRFRSVLNDVEGNFAEESTGTHRTKLQEIFGVINALQEDRDPAKKALGDKMFEEFTRRYAFHTSYVKYATAGDANGVAEGAAGPYDLIHNVLLRDLDHGYYDKYEEPDPRFPNEPNLKSDKELAHNKNLKVWYSFIWYHQKAKQINETAQDEQGQFNDQLKEELKRRFGLNDVDASSSQLLGQRMWEITLRRSMVDEIVNTNTLQGYDMKTKQGGEKGLLEDAKARSVDFKGNMRGGNALARRVLRLYDWLWSQWGNYRFKSLDIVENIDFNGRDMFAHVPGDYEGFLKKEILQIYRSTPLRGEDGRLTTQDPKLAGDMAATEATRITEAILGIKKDKWPKGAELMDFSQMIFTLEDLDHLPRPDNMPAEEFESWKATRRSILEQYKFDEDKKESNDKSTEENAQIKISQHFKEGFFDFRRVRPPAAMLPTVFRGQEEIRGLLTKPDGPLRNPSTKSMLALGEAFNFLNAGQFSRKLEIIRNYVRFEKKGGFYGQTSISDAQTEIIINELGQKLDATLEEIGQAKKELVYYPMLLKDPTTTLFIRFFGDDAYDVLLFYVQARNSIFTGPAILEFFAKLFEGIFKEGMK